MINIIGYLFGKSRGVDDHCIDTAGLGDQWDNGPGPGGQDLIDASSDVARAGEHNPIDSRIGHQARANGAVARHVLERRSGNARRVQEAHCGGSNQGSLFSRLATTAFPAASAAAT